MNKTLVLLVEDDSSVRNLMTTTLSPSDLINQELLERRVLWI